ncbi:streptomycin 3''-kinase [Thalassobacillus devorans]|uniref:Streptomycin 3''-kinase n=1 Tax=Thalassobacillus devorans TaxID=279813 RepID=A0ABQ1NM26_9BACI|nr:aminoglycoside phosphotransferase family protein [Thalassobacillus devorans]NIK27565.1 streptomycin 6-kinase [Thalassobacillus devorans]GGC78733.1 streptomycin 3''-kinase [Thalassobacillus devorans]
MKFQSQFKENLLLSFQKEGEAWLAQLPELIAYCENQWELKIGDPFQLSFNYVAPATRADGTEFVVKLCIPREGFRDELEALRLFAGQGIVSVIAADEERGILLLEKLAPGTMLVEVNKEETSCRLAAKVLGELHRPAPSSSLLPTTQSREANLQRQLREHPDGKGPITRSQMEKACDIFEYLHKSSQQQFLLHGDFHHYNVLASGENEWRAIDPKGLIGEREYDVIQFLLNKLPETDILPVLRDRIDIFVDMLHLNRERLVLWGYCHSVLATSWTVDSHGNYEKRFYQAVTSFEQLLYKYRN